MRQIGVIADERQARRFGDYLLNQGFENEVESSSDGWSVWVLDDDQLEQAQSLLNQFLAQPDDPIYANQSKGAHRLRKEKDQQEQKRRKQFVDVRQRWALGVPIRAELTKILIGISIVVFIGMNADMAIRNTDESSQSTEMTVRGYLSISDVSELQQKLHKASQGLLSLEERDELIDRLERPYLHLPDALGKGQVWRLVTPVFIHFGIIHIVFNMFWLYSLGSMIETRKGWKILLGLVIGVAAISNYIQYAWAGPGAGGMSGVVYGLLGYVWMKGKYEPRSGLHLNEQTVVIMLVWLFICMTDWLGMPIGNAAHVSGLVAGMLFGGISYWWAKKKAA